jgi:methyl-accepting chemotaxis protein
MTTRISTRVVLVFAFFMAAFLLVGYWTYRVSDRISVLTQQVRNDSLTYRDIAQGMRVNVIQVQQFLTDISATRGRDGLDDGFSEAEENYQAFMNGLAKFEQHYRSQSNEAGLAQTKRLRNRMQSYYAMGKQMANAYIESGPAGGNQMMSSFDKSAENLYTELEPFINEQNVALASSMNTIESAVNNLRTGIYTGILLVGLAMLAIGLMLHRSLTRRFRNLLQSMAAVSKGDGDLTRRVEESGGDELSELAIEFNSFTRKIESVISRLNQSILSIDYAAENISQSNSALSERTEEQSGALEESASSMEEMLGLVRQNSDNANHTHQLIEEHSNSAAAGVQVLADAIDAMEEINQVSGRIADIAGTVDSIAFQTNLLALNAAVEAARAGDQGRGFAVVAGEVRSLAQSSAEAAREVKTLIEDSVNKIRSGSDLVNKSGETMKDVSEGIRQLSAFIAEVADSSRIQADGIEQVNQSIAQIDNIAQENSAFVEETAAASRSMRDEVFGLREMMNFFKFRENSVLQSQPVPGLLNAHQENNQHEKEIDRDLQALMDKRVKLLRKTDSEKDGSITSPHLLARKGPGNSESQNKFN